MECLVCGNKNKFKKSFSDRLWQCQECDFVFLDDSKQKDYSFKNYSERLTLDKKERRIRDCRSRLKKIKKFIKPEVNILDIGCHEGIFLKLAQNSGCHVFGLEPNHKMVDYAKKMNLSVTQGTIETFTAEKKFDLVTLFHVLEHLKNPKNEIKKIRDFLKPNGHLVLEVPNIESYLAKKLKDDWPLINSEHLSYFSLKTIKIFLNNNGFSVKEIYFRQFDEWNLNIRESLTRLGFLRYKRKNGNSSEKIKNQLGKKLSSKRFFFMPIRFLLSLLVKVFRRGDYLLIIAQKK